MGPATDPEAARAPQGPREEGTPSLPAPIAPDVWKWGREASRDGTSVTVVVDGPPGPSIAHVPAEGPADTLSFDVIFCKRDQKDRRSRLREVHTRDPARRSRGKGQAGALHNLYVLESRVGSEVLVLDVRSPLDARNPL